VNDHTTREFHLASQVNEIGLNDFDYQPARTGYAPEVGHSGVPLAP
jgi:hypothetical protein